MTRFWTITGHDFARSIAWARRQPDNPINAAIRRKLMTATTEMKVIKRARFFAGGMDNSMYSNIDEREPVRRPNSVINEAEVEFNGIRLFSEVPNSAAKAEKINKALHA